MGKSKTKTRKRAPCCGFCRHPHFWMKRMAWYDGRPQFKCVNCGDTWTCGQSGGEWATAKFCEDRGEMHEPDDWS